MAEYTKISEQKSRILERNSRTSKQSSLSEILRQHKEDQCMRNVNKESCLFPVRQLKKQVIQLNEDDFVDSFKETAKVGLELTFWNADTQKYITNDGFSIGDKWEAITWWERLISQWENRLYDFDPVLYEFQPEAGKNKNLGNGTADMDNPKIVFIDTIDDDKEVFWYQLSMDPGVVEIQTSPVKGLSIEEDGIINDIISQIYEIANNLNLEPGKGGGHLNVDFSSGLDEDYSLVPEIIYATEIIRDKLKKVVDEAEEDYDEENDSTDYKYKRLVDWGYESEDPFISTDRVKMDVDKHFVWSLTSLPDSSTSKDYFSNWNDSVYTKKKVRNEQSLRDFREAHAKWLSIHPTYSQYSTDKKN